jgi:hypothetical protein
MILPGTVRGFETVSLMLADGVSKVPLDVMISPDKTFLSSSTSTSIAFGRTTIYSVPFPQCQDDGARRSWYAAALLSAICMRRPSSDVAHALAQSSCSLAFVESVFDDAMRMLEDRRWGQVDQWLTDVASTAAQVYRLVAHRDYYLCRTHCDLQITI